MPCVPTVIPARSSSRRASASRLPAAPSRPARTKNDAVRRRSRSASNATSTSEALPSSKLIRAAGHAARTSSIPRKASAEIQYRASPGSSSRPGVPMPWKQMPWTGSDMVLIIRNRRAGATRPLPIRRASDHTFASGKSFRRLVHLAPRYVVAVTSTSSVTLRAIGDDDIARAATFLHTHHSSRVGVHDWERAMAPPWSVDQPNHGFLLDDGDRVVGVHLALLLGATDRRSARAVLQPRRLVRPSRVPASRPATAPRAPRPKGLSLHGPLAERQRCSA